MKFICTVVCVSLLFQCSAAQASLDETFDSISPPGSPVSIARSPLQSHLQEIRIEANTVNKTVSNESNSSERLTERYLKCAIALWTISEGWFAGGATIATAASTLLAGAGTLSQIDQKYRDICGITSIVCGGVSIGLQFLKNHSVHAVKQRREQLEQLKANRRTFDV